MKRVERVLTHMQGYHLYLEDGERKVGYFEQVENGDDMPTLKGLEHMQVLEEYLDIRENKKKRIVYREDMLVQIQEAYVCECGGSMVLVDYLNELDEYGAECGDYYDTVKSYKCSECGKEHREIQRCISPYREEY